MHVVGMVLHPERDCSGAVGSILEWAARREIQVLGIDTEIRRLACAAEAVTAEELRRRADLMVSLGGDGTMLRAMRLADGQRSPVLGVNLGKLGFLADVDVPDLADALSAIDNHEFTTEPRLAVDAVIGDQLTLNVLPSSGRLAVEADGNVAAEVEPGDRIELEPRPGAARVVRLGLTTFYERVRRKLRLVDSAEIAIGWP